MSAVVCCDHGVSLETYCEPCDPHACLDCGHVDCTCAEPCETCGEHCECDVDGESIWADRILEQQEMEALEGPDCINDGGDW